MESIRLADGCFGVLSETALLLYNPFISATMEYWKDRFKFCRFRYIHVIIGDALAFARATMLVYIKLGL
jgi:hypothetical protein